MLIQIVFFQLFIYQILNSPLIFYRALFDFERYTLIVEFANIECVFKLRLKTFVYFRRPFYSASPTFKSEF